MRLLIDEDLSPDYVTELHCYNPAIDVLWMGLPRALGLGTLDPYILPYCEREQRALVTENRSTMPEHEQAHFAAGHQHWGILELRPGYGIGVHLAELQLIWEASEAEEYRDKLTGIPL